MMKRKNHMLLLAAVLLLSACVDTETHYVRG